jgi:hypothetical protein
MTSFRRRLGLQPNLLDRRSNNNSQFQVLRTLFFGQRERIRLTMEVGRVPSLGPYHREERAKAIVGRRET